jgi:hypothetical protein
MSDWGQSRRIAPPLTTSGLPPTADIKHRDHHFRKVPQADLGQGKGRSKAALAYKCNFTSTCRYQSGDCSLETFPL